MLNTIVKKLLFPLLVLLLLAGCASSNTTINLAPSIALPSRDSTIQPVTISILGADKRSDPAVARINRNGQLVSLVASRDPRFLLQEALEKQMTARGYQIGANGAVTVQVVIDTLNASVNQGDLRYHITGKAAISVIAIARNGTQFSQKYHRRYSVEGAFQATNRNIANTMNIVLSNIITDMANDQQISNFISKNSR